MLTPGELPEHLAELQPVACSLVERGNNGSRDLCIKGGETVGGGGRRDHFEAQR